MSEEEIEILQYIQYALDNVGSIDFGDFEVDDIQGLLDLYQTKTEQLETALNSLKKEKEKNKKLIEGQTKTLEKLLIPELLKNYISKDKIKEKIKEYQDFFVKNPEAFRKGNCRVIICILKELLEEE